MNKKIIITIIILILLVVGISLINKNKSQTPNITDIPSRNDTAVIPESTSTTTDKVYSIAEVNTHDKPTDCWVVLGDRVIDVTSFIASGEHPNDKILEGCGKDVTEIFAGVSKHSESKPQNIMVKSQIGMLE